MVTCIKIKLNKQEDRELRLIVKRQKAEHREVVRAKIILLLSKGINFSKVTRQVGIARRIVYKWASRFLIERMAGLKDKPRSGRPASFSPDRGNICGKNSLRIT